ncbi:MAG: MltA domain-containing protein [Scytolyngbya sp. HA4215-MV1]|nr:MltA domain-containing protein [Scytolyngbya sp. HA4215-MV1]
MTIAKFVCQKIIAGWFGVGVLLGSWQNVAFALPSRPLFPKPLPVNVQATEHFCELTAQPSDRSLLLGAVDHSLRYLQTPKAIADYRRYSVPGITHDLVYRSLKRFRELVRTCKNNANLQRVIQQEFVLLQATGKDGKGTVAFTGYFEPVHRASRVQTSQYRYPLYRLPADLATWSQPHPTRLQLEGVDGLQGRQGRLKGLELVWLRDRLEAFLIQVQGSSRLQLTDGSTMTLGFAGHTHYPYTGIGRELVKDGKLRQEDLTLSALQAYFERNPQDLSKYLPRNQRFVFFRETGGAPATGSLGVPVTAERSIATDKTQFPPGALALMQVQIPSPNSSGNLEQRLNSRYVLDQDTGGAIIGPGRVDIFMGTGISAGARAGLINSTGQLYYLLLKK